MAAQSRGFARKLAENYTFALTDFIHERFQSRASKAQTAPQRKRLALPAITQRMPNGKRAEPWQRPALSRAPAAGLAAVPQQSNMTEWLAFRRYLDQQSDQHCGWEDIFQTILGASTVAGQGDELTTWRWQQALPNASPRKVWPQML